MLLFRMRSSFLFPPLSPEPPNCGSSQKVAQTIFQQFISIIQYTLVFCKATKVSIIWSLIKNAWGEMCGLSRQLVSEPLCYVLVT